MTALVSSLYLKVNNMVHRLRQYVQSDSAVSEERQRYYHVCTRCDGVSINALWRLEQFDNGLKYQCPRCDQWIGFDEYTANRFDRRAARDDASTCDPSEKRR